MRQIYIAGESYAGQHIPYIARAMLDRNHNETQARPWNLKGLVIGNGWISPEHQYDAYLDFAHAKGLVKEGSDLDKQMQDSLADCHDEMAKEPGHVDYGGCERILSRMLAGLRSGSGNDECVNMYDVRLRDAYPKCGMNWPPDLEYMEPYLQTSAVTEALHVNAARNMGWAECNGNVGNAFSAKKSRASVELLPSLVEEVPILLFSGAEDLICNHLGTEAMINDMEWNGGKGFELTPGNWAPRRNWTFEGDYAGFWQEARNLTYVLFTEASHMVPFDWPRRSRDMLDRFMRVDISSIGGQPSDSRIDGEKLPETTVGGSKEDQQEKADHDAAKDRAKWEAYRRSGEIVLVIVVVASVAWGYFVWSQRRQGNSAYHALGGGSIQMRGVRRQSSHGSSSHGGGRNDGDLESTAFAETDDEEEQGGGHHLRPSTSRQSRSASGSSGGKYTSDEEGGEKPKAKGSPVFVMK